MVSIPATSDCIGHGHHQSSITESIPRYSGHHTVRPKMAHPPTHSTYLISCDGQCTGPFGAMTVTAETPTTTNDKVVNILNCGTME